MRGRAAAGLALAVAVALSACDGGGSEGEAAPGGGTDGAVGTGAGAGTEAVTDSTGDQGAADTGAASDDEPVAPLWTVEAQVMSDPVVIEDTVVATALDGDTLVLRAWELTSGEDRWTVSLGTTPRHAGTPLTVQDGDRTLVLVELEDPEVTDPPPDPQGGLEPDWFQLVALDPRTGETAATSATPHARTTGVHACWHTDAPCLVDWMSGESTSRAVRLDGDQLVLDQPTPDLDALSVIGPGVAVSTEGSPELLGVADGQVAWRTPLEQTEAVDSLRAQAPQDEQLLIGLHTTLPEDMWPPAPADASVVTAVDPEDGAVLWDAEGSTLCSLRAVDAPVALLCSPLGEEPNLRGVDPVTGEQLWTVEDYRAFGGELGTVFLPDDLVMVRGADSVWALDLATGEPVTPPAETTLCSGQVDRAIGDLMLQRYISRPCTLTAEPTDEHPPATVVRAIAESQADGEATEVLVLTTLEGLVAYPL